MAIMELSHTHRYAASPAEVQRMLTDRAFREKVCERQRALSCDVTVTGAGPGAEVVVRQTQAMAGAPAVATKLTGDTVSLEQREGWRVSQEAVLPTTLPGKPVEPRKREATPARRAHRRRDPMGNGRPRVH